MCLPKSEDLETQIPVSPFLPSSREDPGPSAAPTPAKDLQPGAESPLISPRLTFQDALPRLCCLSGNGLSLSEMLPLFPFKFFLHLKVNSNTVVGGRGWGQFPYNLLLPNLGEILLH